MQFVENGPDVPNRLIEAHEDGRVVLFCGAGISSEAGLPSFEELIKKLGEKIKGLEGKEELPKLKDKKFDEVISLLEKRCVGGRKRVRKELAEILTPGSDAACKAKTHKALLTLGKNREGHTRLVTTNVDRMFEAAIETENERNEIKRCEAPGLPVPNPVLWNALVYLHGLLPADLGDEGLDHLIFSSGDLGRAYLNEGWAARFVSELFRNFNVCFIGYSLGDSMLRYMMDALADDKQLGKDSLEVFAFDRNKNSKQVEKWKDKGITPILYDEHCYLHQTLYRWSCSYRDGMGGKQKIVADCAHNFPLKSIEEDHFVNRMLWALKDTSGLPAKDFASLDPTPSLEWLKPLSEERDQQKNLIFFGVQQHQSSDCWDKVKLYLDGWLIKYLDAPDLVLWLIKQGLPCCKFSSKVLRELSNSKLEKCEKSDKLENIPKHAPRATLRPAMRTLWYLLLSGFIKPEPDSGPYQDYLKQELFLRLEQFQRDGLTLSFRQELRNMLTPCVSVSRRLNPQKDDKLKDLFNCKVVLSSSSVNIFLKKLQEKSSWSEALPELLDDFSRLLRDAINLMCELGYARDKYDLSYIAKPLQSKKLDDWNDWTVLIDLCCDAWLEMAKRMPERAKLVVETWCFVPYSVFRRLVFFALAQGDTFSPVQTLDWLLSEKCYWLWSPETRYEVMGLLKVLVPRLDTLQQGKLEEAILAGPQQESKDLDETKQKYYTWQLLDCVHQTRDLGKSADAKLKELTSQYPKSKWGDELHPSGGLITSEPKVHIPEERCDLIMWLKEYRDKYTYLGDHWYSFCQDPKKLPVITEALRALHKDNIWLPHFWRTAFHAWKAEKKLINDSWHNMAQLLIEISNDQLQEISFDISTWLEEVAETLGRHCRTSSPVHSRLPLSSHIKPSQKPEIESRRFYSVSLGNHKDIFFKLCKRILGLEFKDDCDDFGSVLDPVMRATKHPIGCITKALLNWSRVSLGKGQCLPEEIKSIFTDLCDIKVYKFLHGRTLLSCHVKMLFLVDPTWSEKCLLKLFDWNNQDEALAAWSGYLYISELYLPLIKKIEESLIDTADHYEEFSDLLRAKYAGLLTCLALYYVSDQLQHETFSIKKIKEATKKLPKDGLEHTAKTLVHMQKGVGQQRVQYWNNRTLPYLEKIWPESRENRTMEISKTFAELCIETGDEFPSAVEKLRYWLQHLDDCDQILKNLKDKKDKDLDFCKKFPEPALEFLFKVIDFKVIDTSSHVLLRTFLKEIESADLKLKNDNRFKKLKNCHRNKDS